MKVTVLQMQVFFLLCSLTQSLSGSGLPEIWALQGVGLAREMKLRFVRSTCFRSFLTTQSKQSLRRTYKQHVCLKCTVVKGYLIIDLFVFGHFTGKTELHLALCALMLFFFGPPCKKRLGTPALDCALQCIRAITRYPVVSGYIYKVREIR